MNLYSMWPSCSLLPSKAVAVKLDAGYAGRPLALFIRGRKPTSVAKSNFTNTAVTSNVIQCQSLVSSPIVRTIKGLGFRPSPESALFSLLFVLSMAVGAIFSLAIIFIPTINAFRKLACSMDNLSKVVSDEVPATLSSLRLSGLEINELTQQLSILRQKISGRKPASNKPSSSGSSLL